MAQVTVELRHLLETDFKLFDFDYQFDDLNFKKQLEQYVIDYYYDSEIGQETPEMFKRKFVARWKRIIPYYNELYNTTLLQYNPLINYSLSEAIQELSNLKSTQNSTNTMTASGTTTNDDQNIISSEDSSETRNSDYPQTIITASGNYLSGQANTENASNSTTNTTSETVSSDTSNSTMSSTSEDEQEKSYEKTIEGITGVTYQELIRQQRENILRIPDMVCRELKPCFVLVY